MASLTFIDRAGASKKIVGREGSSLMQLAREAGFDELLALCGGCCVCGTCHIRLEGGPVDRVAAIGEYETALLDCSIHRTPQSRLACQVPFTGALDGLIVRIQPEDYIPRKTLVGQP